MKFSKWSQLVLVAAASLLVAALITACGTTLTVDFVFVASAKAAGANSYGEIDVFEINSESGPPFAARKRPRRMLQEASNGALWNVLRGLPGSSPGIAAPRGTREPAFGSGSQTNFTSVPVPLSWARLKLEFE